jgi:hypothetical protein
VKKKTKIICLSGAIAAILLFAVFNFKQRDSYSCATCHSDRHVFQWRLGFWITASLPLSPSWEVVEQSNIYRDLFPAGHRHEWEFGQGSPYYVFGLVWSGCALGAARDMNEFAEFYELDPGFREFLQHRIISGSLTKETLLRVVMLPRSSLGDEPLDADTLKLTERATQLLDEYGL